MNIHNGFTANRPYSNSFDLKCATLAVPDSYTLPSFSAHPVATARSRTVFASDPDSWPEFSPPASSVRPSSDRSAFWCWPRSPE